MKDKELDIIKVTEQALGRQWNNRDLLLEALTHSTYGNANRIPHNQRLEFLGDAVLDLVVGEYLMVQHPNRREDFLSQERARMVCTTALAARSKELGLDWSILVGSSYLREVDSVLADLFEAVVGSLYRDSGDLNIVREAVLRWGVVR